MTRERDEKRREEKRKEEDSTALGAPVVGTTSIMFFG
jgi:hypothetical protein